MLPNWLIKKIDKNKIKDNFIQEQLYIEEYVPTLQDIENNKKEKVEERGIIIIDLF